MEKKNDIQEEKKQTDWHAGFAGGLELGFQRFKDQISIEREHLLSKQSLQIDFLILNKKEQSEIDNSVGRLFREHNIIEYKNPKDDLNIDVIWKAIGYAGIYKSLGDTVNAIPAESISLSIFRSSKPVGLLKHLSDKSFLVEKPFPGIYYVKGLVCIPIQIVVTSEIMDKDFLALRIMRENADENEVREFLYDTKDIVSQNVRQNINAVVGVVSAVNSRLFEKLRGEKDMNDVLRDIMKDDLLAAEITGEEIGVIKKIKKKMADGKTPNEVASELDESFDKVKAVFDFVDKFGFECDPKEIYKKLKDMSLIKT